MVAVPRPLYGVLQWQRQWQWQRPTYTRVRVRVRGAAVRLTAQHLHQLEFSLIHGIPSPTSQPSVLRHVRSL